MKVLVAVCVLALLPAALSERVFAEREGARVEWAQADSIPELTAPVNDFANVIDASSRAELDALIRKLQSATGDTMVVATIKTFKPEADMSDEKWEALMDNFNFNFDTDFDFDAKGFSEEFSKDFVKDFEKNFEKRGRTPIPISLDPNYVGMTIFRGHCELFSRAVLTVLRHSISVG